MKVRSQFTFPFLLFSAALIAFYSTMVGLLGEVSSIVEYELMLVSSVSFSFVFVVDKISISFSLLVLLISGSVFTFSCKYMEGDVYRTRFHWILLAFVISMNFLVFSGSLFFLLLGWDGLGITSFALIIYYQSQDSLTAGMHTLMINRIGDSIIVVSVFLFVFSGQFNIVSLSDFILSSGLVLMLLFAALTKSAQFPFSSWLPAAMAAPTPVSALVHSSTLVTAGIYMLIRLSWLEPLSDSGVSVLLLCGGVTCLLGGFAAVFEDDVKKIVALSTLSQLGVMVFSLGLNLPYLSLFHLFAHALFKALLFLAAGHVLMVGFGCQDIRLLGSVGLSVPFTVVMFNVSSLCLVGAPFLSAFYSKHLILEVMLSSKLNLFSVILMSIATLFTAMYVFRSMKAISWGKAMAPVINPSTSFYIMIPMILLGSSAVVFGTVYSTMNSASLMLAVNSPMQSLLINMITGLGVYFGLVSPRLKSWLASTMFWLSPSVLSSVKLISSKIKGTPNLDLGWLEPMMSIGEKMPILSSYMGYNWFWPRSRAFMFGFLLLLWLYIWFLVF